MIFLDESMNYDYNWLVFLCLRRIFAKFAVASLLISLSSCRQQNGSPKRGPTWGSCSLDLCDFWVTVSRHQDENSSRRVPCFWAFKVNHVAPQSEETRTHFRKRQSKWILFSFTWRVSKPVCCGKLDGADSFRDPGVQMHPTSLPCIVKVSFRDLIPSNYWENGSSMRIWFITKESKWTIQWHMVWQHGKDLPICCLGSPKMAGKSTREAYQWSVMVVKLIVRGVQAILFSSHGCLKIRGSQETSWDRPVLL